MMSREKPEQIWVASGYGGNTRKPFVSMTVRDLKPVQLSPEEARDLAGNLIACAEAADQDAFLVEWFQSEFDLPIERAAQILVRYRDARAAREDDTREDGGS